MRHICTTWLVLAVPTAVAIGQTASRPACEVLLVDGRMLPADRLDSAPGGGLRVTAGGQARDLAAGSVLAVHGSGVPGNTLSMAVLRGGDVLRGLLVGGDAAGNHFELQSPVLGRQRLPVDRLECLLFRVDLARAEDLVLPEDDDEALFLQATLGLDRVVGTVHQFGEPGIRFQPASQPEPRWYAPRDLVGLRLGGAVAAEVPGKAELCTRSGDRVALTAYEFAGDAVNATLENGSVCTVALADLACLVKLDTGAVFASSLTPQEVREAAHDGDVLLPWRRDAAVTGGPLLAGGRCHARGFGVHSRSRLVFAVPAGAAAFVARVGFDDSVLQLPIRGAVDATVRVGDAVRFQHKGLRAGDPLLVVGPLPVRPGEQLALEIEFGAGRDLGDRVDWLMPVFLPEGAAGTAAK